MLKFAAKSTAKRFIIATENGIIHALKKQNPDAEFFPASHRAICPNMKKITIDKLVNSLQEMRHKITVPEAIRIKAQKSLDRMVEVLPVK
jgi:quinolinate synthase